MCLLARRPIVPLKTASRDPRAPEPGRSHQIVILPPSAPGHPAIPHHACPLSCFVFAAPPIPRLTCNPCLPSNTDPGQLQRLNVQASSARPSTRPAALYASASVRPPHDEAPRQVETEPLDRRQPPGAQERRTSLRRREPTRTVELTRPGARDGLAKEQRLTHSRLGRWRRLGFSLKPPIDSVGPIDMDRSRLMLWSMLRSSSS